MPFSLNFADKTPNSSKPALCETCRWAGIMKNPDGLVRVFCQMITSTQSEIRMKVTECNGYVDRKSQTLDEMKQTAWILGTKKIVGLAGGAAADTQITWTKPEDKPRDVGCPTSDSGQRGL